MALADGTGHSSTDKDCAFVGKFRNGLWSNDERKIFPAGSILSHFDNSPRTVYTRRPALCLPVGNRLSSIVYFTARSCGAANRTHCLRLERRRHLVAGIGLKCSHFRNIQHILSSVHDQLEQDVQVYGRGHYLCGTGVLYLACGIVRGVLFYTLFDSLDLSYTTTALPLASSLLCHLIAFNDFVALIKEVTP
ncbi:hypothetical protein AAG570_000908 [Ranatra chinensis]|uniref:Uncharacterized protein n=1 Tax=Ranatra chinensis TaxID=642074 RepID=A0ABD0Z8V5_9HEMI